MKYKLKHLLSYRYDIYNFFRNLWLFKECMWHYRRWDYSGLLHFMETCARDMSKAHTTGNLVRSEQTAKELLIVAELVKRIREDEYVFNKGRYEHTGKGILGMEFVQKEHQLPKNKAKSFYKLVDSNRKADLELLTKILKRKLLTFWD